MRNARLSSLLAGFVAASTPFQTLAFAKAVATL
jgi:hypothetical protein